MVSVDVYTGTQQTYSPKHKQNPEKAQFHPVYTLCADTFDGKRAYLSP
jgi:hypothetical protein